MNWITAESQRAILEHLDGSAVFDLGIEYFFGMPSWTSAQDPKYEIWMTHTPQGSVIDNLSGAGPEVHEKYSYCGDSIHMYIHTGTHIDTLNHLGYFGMFWNGWTADRDLGSRVWQKGGVEKYPPLIARGVLLDIAGLHGVDCLPDGHVITAADMKRRRGARHRAAPAGRRACCAPGRMTCWPDPDTYIPDNPGLGPRRCELPVRGRRRDVHRHRRRQHRRGAARGARDLRARCTATCSPPPAPRSSRCSTSRRSRPRRCTSSRWWRCRSSCAVRPARRFARSRCRSGDDRRCGSPLRSSAPAWARSRRTWRGCSPSWPKRRPAAPISSAIPSSCVSGYLLDAGRVRRRPARRRRGRRGRARARRGGGRRGDRLRRPRPPPAKGSRTRSPTPGRTASAPST